MFRGLLLILALHAVPAAAEQTISLHCARGVPDYPDAEMHLGDRNEHAVHIVYVGFRPSRGRAEWSVRDCLNTASKLDASRDITAFLWYREKGQRQQQAIEPFGASSRLVYKASSKRVVVERERPYSLSLAYSLGSSLSSTFSSTGTR